MLADLFSLAAYDLVFVITATLFNLLIAAIFIAQKRQRPDLVRVFGILWLALGIPLLLVFIHYLGLGKELWLMIYFGLVLFYMLVELLLDYIFKFDFRSKPSTHIPYIVLEYIALFGLIGISFAVNRTWGFIVSISFWILLGSLIYLYRGRRNLASG
ncbi:MAG: hypothetical protein JSV61_02700 [Anaerolineales bacterium]|nr:MAG: hypothetical protein JSV61_02700 [Anaerolineales bacterium]